MRFPLTLQACVNLHLLMNELKDGYLLISVMEMTKKRHHLAEIQLKTI